MNEQCDHSGEVEIMPDHFYRDAKGTVARAVPGDCVCAKCYEPLAVVWNGGKPMPVVAVAKGEGE